MTISYKLFTQDVFTSMCSDSGRNSYGTQIVRGTATVCTQLSTSHSNCFF
jgi:hypothetical protein